MQKIKWAAIALWALLFANGYAQSNKRYPGIEEHLHAPGPCMPIGRWLMDSITTNYKPFYPKLITDTVYIEGFCYKGVKLASTETKVIDKGNDTSFNTVVTLYLNGKKRWSSEICYMGGDGEENMLSTFTFGSKSYYVLSFDNRCNGTGCGVFVFFLDSGFNIIAKLNISPYCQSTDITDTNIVYKLMYNTGKSLTFFEVGTRKGDLQLTQYFLSPTGKIYTKK